MTTKNQSAVEVLREALTKIEHSMRQAKIPGNDRWRELDLSHNIALTALAATENEAIQVAGEAFVYTGQQGSELEDCVEGYTHGTRFYAAPQSATPTVGAIAWAVLADNGNIRFWSYERANVKKFAATIEGANVVPIIGAASPAQAKAEQEKPFHYYGLSAEQLQLLLDGGLKPEEIAGPDDAQHDRVGELVRWFARFTQGHANPKWATRHACELAYFIATNGMNRSIDLEAVRKAGFKEGVNITPQERGMLERIGFATPAATEANSEASELPPVPNCPEPVHVWTALEREAITAYGQLCRDTAPDTDENAPWLTLAHTICADAGVPCGHITDRLKVLRELLDARQPVAAPTKGENNV